MTRLQFRTAGESHGPALVGIVEGIPSGLELNLEAVDGELARRQGGYGRGGRMKIESDRLELLSGTRGGVTLGSPLAFRIHNADAVIEELPVPANPRPGHADLAGCLKHGHRDPRAVLERASARETAARVGAGALARQVLEAFGIEVFAHVLEVGGVSCAPDGVERVGDERHTLRDGSPFMSLDPEADRAMAEAVDKAREEKDSLGGVFEVCALGLPAGLGSYSSGLERLTSRLGAALFSVPAIKSVEVGLGLEAARRRGSQVHDPILPAPQGAALRYSRSSNNAGGLEGGLTNGEPLVLRAAMKPIPSLRQGLPSVDFESGEAVRATYQRSDVTSVPAASVVGEAVVALALTEAFLDKYGGDSMDQVRAAQRFHQEQMKAI
ncbi:MAG TPA: chorismate synthase [Planctomycetota bacterium]|nr:chorismate synthase [Planctomycetaceae bacterium]HJM58670.1 chorismate synthase [Planctomycetota bacterium]